ncbi:hypothetical protein SLEP1_g60004, partial [Rubroshorea leprosula]
SMTDLK